MTVDLPIEDSVYENRMRSTSIRAPPRGVQEVIKGRNLRMKLFRTEYNLTLFRMRGGSAIRPPTTSSPVTFAKVGISPKNFWLLISTLLTHLCKISRPYVSASPKLLNLNQEHPSKNVFFWSNPYKIEIMLTSLIEILELLNFGHMTLSTV